MILVLVTFRDHDAVYVGSLSLMLSRDTLLWSLEKELRRCFPFPVVPTLSRISSYRH